MLWRAESDRSLKVSGAVLLEVPFYHDLSRGGRLERGAWPRAVPQDEAAAPGGGVGRAVGSGDAGDHALAVVADGVVVDGVNWPPGISAGGGGGSSAPSVSMAFYW